MGDACGRLPGRVDRHVEPVGRDQRERVVAHVRAAALERGGEGARAALVLRPTGAGERRVGAGGREIGHRHHLEAGGAPGLGQEHGAELAGADQPDAHRPAGLGTRAEHPMEVHGALL